MENMFIYKEENQITKAITYRSKYDWNGFWKPLKAFLDGPIDYDTDYREWVIQWKAYEKELVAAIKFFRKCRIEASSGYEANCAQSEKISLRPWATKFYNARKIHKENFKKSEFFQKRELNKVNSKELETC